MSPFAAKSGPRDPKGSPGEAQEAPRTAQEGQERPRGGPREAQETPRGAPGANGSDPGSAQGEPQKALERPRSGPRAPEVPRRAQNGSLGVKTNGFYEVFASPDLKNVGLAKVFKRCV